MHRKVVERGRKTDREINKETEREEGRGVRERQRKKEIETK